MFHVEQTKGRLKELRWFQEKLEDEKLNVDDLSDEVYRKIVKLENELDEFEFIDNNEEI